MSSSRYVRVKDEVTWQQFGAPDPGFFDRHIKDVWLAVIGTSTWYFRLQDPTDPDSEFVVSRDLIVEPNLKQAS